MKINLIATAIACFLFVSKLSAQQEPKYTHYMFNTLTYNPAYAGSKQAICANLLYHNQWTKFKSIDEGSAAPLTETFNIMGLTPLGAKAGTAAGKLGIGLSIINDKINFSGATNLKADFAYRFEHLIPFARYVSVGLGLGMIQESIDGTHWHAENPADPRLPGTSSSTIPDADFGIYMGNDINWYAGISTTHLLQSKASWKTITGGNIDIPIKSAYYLTGGYNRDITTDIELQAYGQYETDFTKGLLSLSAMALYQKKVYAGITGRFEKITPLSIMVGYYPKLPKGAGNGDLLVGFAYDIDTGPKPFGGSPEIFLRYCFNLTVTTKENIFPKDAEHL